MSIYNDDGAKREISVIKLNIIKEKTLRYFLVEEIDKLKENSENKTLWKLHRSSWAESKNFETNLLIRNKIKQVDEMLQKFLAEIL